ncbi:NTP transferase domain-containing protein [Massilia sp. CCM 8733]|uniref:NTP transferase domain-containing protein n=1 Tax=Massilia mucilaginosa TaxID=2609282 RepID=A0ABX0NWB5_9BURK|nr:nucleotidyltransferase family protein [Massilia mucilaginosa]NHZ90945.1 NTP transferase domain-containing protein [Massilia mucilaginosa]
MTPVGILLAAGRGRRFDPTGAASKLLQPLPGGELLVAASARVLLSCVDNVIAVVRPDDGGVGECLRALGCIVTVCHDADSGMAASLVHALRHAPDAPSWLIALGDMPYVRAGTMLALRAALEQGAPIVVPVHAGQRGNPVGFGRAHREALLALRGDQGARAILKAQPVSVVSVDDPGVVSDIDTVADLLKTSTLA